MTSPKSRPAKGFQRKLQGRGLGLCQGRPSAKTSARSVGIPIPKDRCTINNLGLNHAQVLLPPWEPTRSNSKSASKFRPHGAVRKAAATGIQTAGRGPPRPTELSCCLQMMRRISPRLTSRSDIGPIRFPTRQMKVSRRWGGCRRERQLRTGSPLNGWMRPYSLCVDDFFRPHHVRFLSQFFFLEAPVLSLLFVLFPTAFPIKS